MGETSMRGWMREVSIVERIDDPTDEWCAQKFSAIWNGLDDDH